EKMSESIKRCMNCPTTESKFRSLKDAKWEEAEKNNLIKETWVKGGKLCHNCYMNFVENPLRRGSKRAMNKGVSVIDLVRAIETMARIFYEREHVKKEGPIYSYDELRKVFQANKDLEDFLDQLYSVARPLERTEQTMSRIKKLIVHICYLLASLNNTKINSFKFDVAYYLDSVGTSNEGLDTMATLASDAHEEYVENALSKFPGNAFVLNVDDYHNIHVPRQSDSTSTSRPAHMTTIIANSCLLLALPHNGAFNPKFIDDELIIKHLDEQFIINLGIPYHERVRDCIGYVITDRHLPRGFVTARKPFTNVLCDYRFCDYFLKKEIKRNVEALKENMTKDLGENEFIVENTESAIENDSDEADTAKGDAETTSNLLEQARKDFVEL
ncbi:39346_t:CDS:2, partial [Gigaspora margarita]